MWLRWCRSRRSEHPQPYLGPGVVTRAGVMVVGLPLDHLTLHHALHRLPLKVRQPRGVTETLGEGIAINLQFCDLTKKRLAYGFIHLDLSTSIYMKPFGLQTFSAQFYFDNTNESPTNRKINGVLTILFNFTQKIFF